MITITDNDFYSIINEQKLSLASLTKDLVNVLNENGLKIATAESCTGGLLSKSITEISGASNVFDCGVCSYANHIKHSVLGVQNETLNKYGAVSPQTAIEMARGVQKLSKSHIGISTTGIAGPTGGTADKPVGLVYMGIVYKNQEKVIKSLLNTNGKNSRFQVRELASMLLFYNTLKLLS